MSDQLAILETSATGVARILLSRPNKRNALSRRFLEELLIAVDAVAVDKAVRLLILEAAGPVFCAGMDLSEMQSRAGRADAQSGWQEDTRLYRELLEKLFRLSVPTMAVVQGAAIAGGLGLVLACDLVIASEDAVFALPEPKRGITAAVVTPLLAYRMGPGMSGYLLLSGRRISATDGLRWGLCHEIVTADELMNRRDELAKSVLTGSQSALAVTKANLIEGAAAMLADWLDTGMAASARARETEDAREGLAAFLEKRDPRWLSDP